jgi:hypothetical protein
VNPKAIKSLPEEELLNLIFEFWQNCFCELPEDFKSKFQSWLGLSYKFQANTFSYYRSLSLNNLRALRERLLKDSYYPKNSNLNLFFGASTIPITPFPEILYSFLLQTPIICRIPENYSLEFYNYFKDRLPSKLKGCLEFAYWPSANNELTQQYVNKADCLIVHGSDRTIEQLCQLAPNKHFLGFGHKASFAVCKPSSDAVVLVQDIISFKQNGCLSPQVVYVLNAADNTAKAFAQELAAELAKTNFELTPAQVYHKQAFIEDVLLKDDCQIFNDCIIFSQSQNYHYSPGNGLLWVKPLKGLQHVQECVSSLKGQIGCIGHNLDEKEQLILQQMFPAIRLSELGQMQNPSLFWLQEPSSLNIQR